MSVLSPASKTALANLRAFTASPTNYYKCPLTRRAAVLILLIADRWGDLRVVLTIRSAGLKNYAGQAALPGGKADTLAETPFQTARREAFEEIGLPMSDHALPPGYSVEHLTELPANLAMTELGVRPCVAYLRAPAPTPQRPHPDASRDILPTLDAREVAAVFTAPFRNFLHARDLEPSPAEQQQQQRLRRPPRPVPGEWYKGSWHSWHESAWRMHQFFVPVSPSTVFLARTPRPYTSPRAKVEGKSGGAGVDDRENTKREREEAERNQEAKEKSSNSNSSSSSSDGKLRPPLPRSFYANAPDTLQQPRYRVFGMTARILVDCARVAYGQEPEYEHNSHFGDEDMIARLIKIGRLSPVRKEGEILTREVMNQAANAKL